MLNVRVTLVVLLLATGASGFAEGEVLVGWDQARVPASESLGISSLVVPAENSDAIRDALSKGYRVYLAAKASGGARLQLPPGSFAGVVLDGTASSAQLQAWRRRLPAPARVLSTIANGKWPHIRLSWVTLRDDVLQVSSRTAQPWIENNGALVRLSGMQGDAATKLLTYAWEPITVSDMHQGPSLEDYLVAIAEVGTFGGNLVLPLHESFQRRLLLGDPVARAEWQDIRRYLEFYSWDLPRSYRRISNVGVITAEPTQAYETLNLLTRHNVSFDVIEPGDLPGRKLDPFALLVVLDEPGAPQLEALTRFANAGGTVVLAGPKGPFPWQATEPAMKTEQQVTYRLGSGMVVQRGAVDDPNAFALEVRGSLPRDKRVLEIWNGTTVLANAYEAPDARTVMITLLNYAHVPSPIQMRVHGAYSVVRYESPEGAAVLVPFQHRDGQTEFVLPELRVGGRVFLSRDGSTN